MPKIGQDNPTFSKQLPALPGCFDVPHPGMGRAEETPPELGRKGKRRHCPGTPLARWDRVGSCRIPGRTVGWLDQLLRGAARAMSGVPAGGEWATSAPSAATHCGGWDHRDAPGPSAPPPSLTPAPLLCPSAREQLRRSRHSRTFLVESGVGELWSEMQAGRRGDGQCTPPQQTPSRRRFTGGGDRTSRSPHRCCLAPRVTLGERMGGWMYPPVAEPPRDPQRGPASTRGGSCRGGDTAPVCHSVPAPRRMLVRVGGGCLPPSRPTVPSKHRNVPLLPSKTSSAFFLGGGQTPIFWLNRGGGGIPWGKRSPAAHSRVPAAPPNPRDGCPRGSALLRCWGTPHSGWGGTRDPHSALVRARR